MNFVDDETVLDVKQQISSVCDILCIVYQIWFELNRVSWQMN